MIQPQMLFLISWLCLLFYQGTEDMEQPIKYHHIFSALGKAIQETDCVYISHLWGGCISWKQCRIFPSLYSQRRIKNKNPSLVATQNKQKKNNFKHRNTLLHDEYACGRIFIKSVKNLPKGCFIWGAQQRLALRAFRTHTPCSPSTGPRPPCLLRQHLQGHKLTERCLTSSKPLVPALLWVRRLVFQALCAEGWTLGESTHMLHNLPELHFLHGRSLWVTLEDL